MKITVENENEKIELTGNSIYYKETFNGRKLIIRYK